MHTIDDVIHYLQVTSNLVNNLDVSKEVIAKRIDTSVEELKEIQTVLNDALIGGYQHIQRLCKNNITTETPPEVKEIQK